MPYWTPVSAEQRLINNGPYFEGRQHLDTNALLTRNKRSPEPKPFFGFGRRYGYYSQPYSYGYSYGRGFGGGYGGYGYRSFGGYGGYSGYGGYGGFGRGRLLRAGLVVGGAALAGGLIGSALGRGK